MAQVDIGKIKIVWKGPWNSGTAYTVDDAVSHSGSSYICIQAGTNQNPSTATAYWQQMSAKGTDADLINISGTVQGDIYYNNGSAIARLAPGTASQVLQTGGAGANPSWTTMSSDVVKLASYDITSTTAEFSFVGFSNDIYAYYRCQFSSLRGDNNNHRPRLRFIDSSGSVISAGDYTWLSLHPYSTGTPNYNFHGSHNDTSIDLFDNGVGTTQSQYGYVEFAHEDLVNSREKPFILHGASRESGGQVNVHIGGGQYRGTANCSGASGGFKIINNSGSFVDGQITLYGFKK